MADEPSTSPGGDTTIEQTIPQRSTQPNTTHCTIIRCYFKGRPSPDNAKEKFAAFLTEMVGERRHKWKFFPEPHPPTHKAHTDIFPVQARVQLTAQDGEASEDFADLRAELNRQIHNVFPHHDATPLVLLFREMRGGEEILKSISRLTLLNGFTGTRRSGRIATGDSSIGEALLEPLFIVMGISVVAYSFFTLRSYLKDPTPPPSSTTSREHLKKAAKSAEDHFNIASTFLKFAKQASTLPGKQKKLESIADGRLQLKRHCSQLKEDFDGINARVSNMVTPSNGNSDKGVTLSTEDKIEVAQLVMGLSNSLLRNKETLDQLFPLLEEEYSRAKKWTNGVTAGVGGLVALYVAVACCSPFLPFSVWGGKWLASHLVASACIGGAGTVTAGVCGTLSYSNKKQCERRTDVRANDVRVKKARSRFLVWLLISLIDEEQPTCLDESLTSKEKADIYEKMGIQIDLVNLGNYKAGQLKTAWEELSDAVTQYLGSCEELAKPAE